MDAADRRCRALQVRAPALAPLHPCALALLLPLPLGSAACCVHPPCLPRFQARHDIIGKVEKDVTKCLELMKDIENEVGRA